MYGGLTVCLDSNNSHICILTDYMPSAKAKMNRSPIMDTRPQELYKSASVGRPGLKSGDRSPSVGRPLPGMLIPSPGTKRMELSAPMTPQTIHVPEGSAQSNTSSNTVLSSSDQNNDLQQVNLGGSFRGMLHQQNIVSPLYSSSRTVPVYVAHTPMSSFNQSEGMSFSQPVSRSTSRADSFKNMLGQLQVHGSEGYLPPSTSIADAAFLSTGMETLAGNVRVSQSTSATSLDRKTNASHSSKNLSTASSGDYTEELMITLPEASQEYFAPPPAMFADNSRDITPDSSLSLTLNTSASSSVLDSKHSKSGSTENVETDSEQVCT